MTRQSNPQEIKDIEALGREFGIVFDRGGETNLLWHKINKAIHMRQTRYTKSLIIKYLKRNKYSNLSCLHASEFYRRINEPIAALKVLPKEYGNKKWSSMDDIEKNLQLQLMRILNGLGGAFFSLRIVDHMTARDKVRYSAQIGEIYLSNYLYQNALECFEGYLEASDEELNRKSWLGLISLADCYAGLDRFDVALRTIERVYKNAESPLIRAIARQAAGQYLVQSGDSTSALRYLRKAEKFFEPDDPTIDHGLLLKWLGACFVQQRKFDEANRYLRRALGILYKPGIKPEAWLEVLFWQGRSDPGILDRTVAIAGREHPIVKLMAAGCLLDEPKMLFGAKNLVKQPLSLHYDRASDTKIENGKRKLGLSLVDDFICHLIIAGRWGIPQFKLYELLWPDEPFSFFHMQKRLEQLVLRGRNQGFRIGWKNLHLWMKTPNVSCDGEPMRVVRGLRFLQENQAFVRRDVQKYFNISQASAGNLCRDWFKENLISKGAEGQYISKRFEY